MKTPEQRLNEILDGLQLKKYDNYPDRTFYFKGHICYLDYSEDGDLFCSDGKIWSVLREEYQLENSDIHILIKKVMEQRFNFKNVYPYCGVRRIYLSDEERLNLFKLTK